MTAREQWKIAYRRLRVCHREQRKANWDMMIYGTGVLVVPSDGGDPYHVPIEGSAVHNSKVQFTIQK